MPEVVPPPHAARATALRAAATGRRRPRSRAPESAALDDIDENLLPAARPGTARSRARGSVVCRIDPLEQIGSLADPPGVRVANRHRPIRGGAMLREIA